MDNDWRECDFYNMASTNSADSYPFVIAPVRPYREPEPVPYNCLYCGSTMPYKDTLKKGHCLRCGAPMSIPTEDEYEDSATVQASYMDDDEVPAPKKQWWEFWK